MSLKWRYWISIGLLHGVLALLVYRLLFENPVLFVLGEIFLVISLFFSFTLFRKLIAPVQFISAGVDAIKSEDFQVKYLPVGSREMDKLISTYNEMIDHLRSERVKNSEQHFFLEKLIEKIPTGIILLNFDEKMSSVNPSAQAFLDELSKEGIQWSEFLSLEENKSEVVTIGSARKYKVESSSFLHMGFNRRYFIIHDLTSEILKSEKESYGKVIRMMAHEVNNTIGPVNSIIDSVISHISSKGDQDYREGLEIAQERNEQLNVFMRNFADLVRLPSPSCSRQNMSLLVEDVISLYMPLLNDLEIELKNQVEDDIYALIDPVLIRQVLINIIKNAQEAISETSKSDGIIEVLLNLNEGRPHLQIIDNGKGIDPEYENEIFTPFFSTKQNGQGIGLTLIRDILTNHEATFRLFTENEKTIFDIYFQKVK